MNNCTVTCERVGCIHNSGSAGDFHGTCMLKNVYFSVDGCKLVCDS